MAAGFTIKKDNLDLFKEFINNHYNKSKHITHKLFSYDAELSFTAINKSFYDDIKKLEPFGNGNPNPTFLFKDLKVIKTKILIKNIFL